MNNIKTHYSCADLAAMRLQGYPATERGWRNIVERENWNQIEVPGKGGRGGMRKEYKPSRTVADIILQHLVKNSSATTETHTAVALPASTPLSMTGLFIPRAAAATELKDWQRKSAEARSAILQEVKRLAAVSGMEKAIQTVITLAQHNELPEQLQRMVTLANARADKEGQRTLSRRSIYRWMKESEQGFAALAPLKSQGIKVPAWAPALLQLYQQPQKPTLKKCMTELESALPAGVGAPSYWAAKRFLDKMSNLDLARGRMLPRELKSVRAFVRRDTSQMWPGDAYTADGHTFDAEIAHPKHGRPFRPEITSVIDIATRKSVGWSVDLAESTWAVLDALRCSVENCGIPSIFYVDNGSGYKNGLMGDDATGFMARLGISLTHSIPYNSQARGIIERSHQTIWVNAAKELPTYMGSAMDRQAKQATFKVTRADINAVGTSRLLMPWHEFVKWCQAKVEAYNDHPHRGLPRITDPITGKSRHQTPNEAWQAAMSEGWEPTMLAAAESDDLFRPYKIGKTLRAEVRLFGNTYFHRDLEHYHGEQVRIGYDIRNAERVWVRDLDGRLICVAGFEANKTSYFPVTQIQAANEKRAQGRIKRAEAKIEEAQAELKPSQLIEYQPTVELPPIAIQPAAGVQSIKAEPLSENVTAMPASRPNFTTDAAKYRWLQANAREVSDQDNKWLDWYCNSAEWEDLFGDVGEMATR